MEKIEHYDFNKNPPSQDLLVQVQALDQLYFSHPWTSSSWGQLLESRKSVTYDLFVLQKGRENRENKEEIMGFALFLVGEHDPMAHLLKIFIGTQDRRQGRGVKLLQSSMLYYRQNFKVGIFLEVESTNHQAICFYQKMEFITLHLCKNFYGSGHHALKMIRSFDNHCGQEIDFSQVL